MSSVENVDVVFSFDTTGSMYKYLEKVRENLDKIVKNLKSKIPGIKIAIFAHGDYCDELTYVTKFVDFTNSEYELCNFIQSVESTGGGDLPECYELVLCQVHEELSWRTDAQKTLVMIGDAPPHEADEEQNYRHLDWKTETLKLRDKNIKINAVQCGRDSSSDVFYNWIASQTFGHHVSLDDIEKVEEVLVRICFREAGIENDIADAIIEEDDPIEETTDDDNDDDDEYDELDSNQMGQTQVQISFQETVLQIMYYFTKTYDQYYLIQFYKKYKGLICKRCGIGKLSREFPPAALNEACEHPIGICLRCTIDHFDAGESECPHEGCTNEPKELNLTWFRALLNEMFLDYAKMIETREAEKCVADENKITVTTIHGESHKFDFTGPDMTVKTFKELIQEKLDWEPSQQKLLHNEDQLKNIKPNGELYKLSEYGVDKSATVYLIIPLFRITENLEHVVFDLSWGFPADRPDFLDATCFAFDDTEFVQVIDWTHSTEEYYLENSIQHSEKNKKRGWSGHQEIHVHPKKVPSQITHLYFTLSSWRSPNLSAFTKPTLQFYEASKPDVNLCETCFKNALDSQAVVMCSVVRAPHNQWYINRCEGRAQVNGNAKHYNPIKDPISELIAEGEKE